MFLASKNVTLLRQGEPSVSPAGGTSSGRAHESSGSQPEERTVVMSSTTASRQVSATQVTVSLRDTVKRKRRGEQLGRDSVYRIPLFVGDAGLHEETKQEEGDHEMTPVQANAGGADASVMAPVEAEADVGGE
ncbi:hypothetical protein PF007_g6530 [Phytophthora fragariae]|nr:hypothetical protein PF007_g6530 [Phytophthora fragariae]KAE9319331.1 hypothetical protein PF001_g5947 [Phytophthora fragariae]